MAVNNSTGGIIPVRAPIQQAPEYSAMEGVIGLADTGLSLFNASQKNAQLQYRAEADNRKLLMEKQGSDATASFISEVEQVRATKGGIAAQTFAAQNFAQIQASLPAGAREAFVKNVKASLGFDPIGASTNRLIDEEEAARAKAVEEKEKATAIYLASVDQNNPEAVQAAYTQVESMSPEQIGYILDINAAQDLRVQKELQALELANKRESARDVKRNKATRLATTAVSAGFNKVVAGYQVRLEQAIASGDVNTIIAVQREGLASLDKLEASLNGDALQIVQGMGYQDVDVTVVNSQIQPLRNQINALRSAFKLTDLQNATEQATKYIFTTALNRTAREDTELGQVATAVLSDQLYGTSFGQNFVEKWATKELLHGALTFNSIDSPEPKAATKMQEDTVTQGSVFAVQNLDPSTPNLPELVSELTQGQVSALKVGINKPEVKSQLATGVIQNWEAAAFGQNTNAIRSKVFEPLLDFFSDSKNAQAYRTELAGSEDTYLTAAMEYVKGNVMPALSQSIGVTGNDLSTQFNVEVRGGKFRLTPKEVNTEGLSEFSSGGAAAKQATSRRRLVANAARKTEALYNKVLLTYSNLYGVDMNTVMEVFGERYAKALGAELVQINETE